MAGVVVQEGKQGYGWWLWVLWGPDTVVYVLDASRSHAVPEGHYRAQSRGVLMVDRYAAYKAMIWVKDGVIVLAFCWSHVKSDFVRVGKGWPQLKPWALEWLRRIRVLYQLNHRRLAAEKGSAAFGEADCCLRQAVAEIEGADGGGTGPGGSADAVPESAGEPGSALGGADAVRGRPADPDGQQYLRATCTGSGGGAEELLRLGFALEWPVGGDGVLDLRHVGDVGAQSPEVADVVL